MVLKRHVDVWVEEQDTPPAFGTSTTLKGSNRVHSLARRARRRRGAWTEVSFSTPCPANGRTES